MQITYKCDIKDRWPGVGATRPTWRPVMVVAGVRGCRPRRAGWGLRWGKSNRLVCAPGVTPGPQEEEGGSQGADRFWGLGLWTPPFAGPPPAVWECCQPASALRRHHVALTAHSNHVGSFRKTPRPRSTLTKYISIRRKSGAQAWKTARITTNLCPSRSTEGQEAGVGARPADVESCFGCCLVVWPWTSYLTSLSFSFPICKMGLAIILQDWG